MFRTFFAAIVLAAPLAAACTDPVVDEDEFVIDDVVDATDDTKADLGATSTYYQVTPDYRRCASPMCGGVFYKLLNATTTQCIDGRRAERCYAASVDWTRLGLNADGVANAQASLYEGDLVVRGSIGRKSWGASGAFGELRPTEAWDGKGPNQPAGVFTKVELTGVRCISKPCPFFREGQLNGSGTANLAELGWDASGATQEQIDAANADMLANKLIIAGDRYTVTGPAGRMAARTVTNFYQRVTNPPPPPPVSVASHDWYAWISAEPGAPRSFHVTGTVELPNPGYSASLAVANPQGSNRSELVLDLKVQRPSGGFWPQVITPVEVRFDQNPLSVSYRTVLVREPDGDTVRMNVTTAF